MTRLPYDAAGARDGASAMSATHLPVRVSVAHSSEADVVTVSGSLDVATASALRDVVFDPSACTRPTLVLYLDDLEFLDARGIATLVATRRRVAAREGTLVIACARPHLRRLLRITRLDTVVPVVASVDEALGRPQT